MKTQPMKNILSLLTIITIMASCSVSKHFLKLSEVPGYEESEDNKMILLNFQINKTGEVQLLDKRIAPGKVKQMPSGYFDTEPIRVLVYYTAQKEPLVYEYSNPLNSSMEVFDPSGKIEKVEQEQAVGFLNVRIPFDKLIEKIELKSDGLKTYLLKIEP